MYTLYIDTHTNALELALFKNGKLWLKKTKLVDQNQSSLIMSLLIELLTEATLRIQEISDILVVNGPGSFTGIRIGVTIAKTLAYLLNIPIRVMSSLLIKAVSDPASGHHWFVEEEKNGYFVGEFNDLDEHMTDYFYVKKNELQQFQESHELIFVTSLNYEAIYDYSRKIAPRNPHLVNPLYVKLIEVQR